MVALTILNGYIFTLTTNRKQFFAFMHNT